MANRLTATSPTWTLLPIRLTLGTIMMAHGAQKLFGLWGGSGLSSWLNRPAPLDLRPSWLWMGAAAFSEFLGGVLVMLGFYTRVGAFLISCVMLVAIFGFHWPRGFFLTAGGFEFALSLLGMAVALLIEGGGQASLDIRS